jgi:flagellar biosynthesis component FlhA
MQPPESPGAAGESRIAVGMAETLALTDEDVARLEGEFRAAVAELMQSTGIPGHVVVTVQRSSAAADGRLLWITVNGRRCPFPEVTWQWAHLHVTGVSLDDLDDLAKNAGGQLAQVIFLTGVEAIKLHVSALLGSAQAQVYCDSLPVPTVAASAVPRRKSEVPVAPAWLKPVLEKLLDLGCSISDRQTVANVVASSTDRTAEQVTERLLSALRPTTVDLILPPQDLKRLPLAVTPEKAELFTVMRDGLASELGLRFPPFRFVLDAKLATGLFCFKIGCLRSLPLRLLGPDKILVNDTPARLGPDRAAQAAIIPGSNMAGALVDRSLAAELQGQELTTWDESQYVILALASYLRQNAACFMNTDTVQALLAASQLECPRAVQQLSSCMSIEQTSTVLRALLAGRIPIRRRALIFSRIVEYCDLMASSAAGADEDGLVEFIRRGLRREIRYRFSLNDTMVVYLLDSQIEEILSRELRTRLVECEAEEVLLAIRREIARLPRTAAMPCLLTTPSARPRLTDLVRREFPGLAVLCHEDLPPDTNIQPVARIALS